MNRTTVTISALLLAYSLSVPFLFAEPPRAERLDVRTILKSKQLNSSNSAPVRNAYTLYYDRRFEESLQVFTELVHSEPNDPCHWYFKAFCERHLGQLQESDSSLTVADVLQLRNESDAHRVFDRLERIQGPLRLEMVNHLNKTKANRTQFTDTEIISQALIIRSKSEPVIAAELLTLSQDATVVVLQQQNSPAPLNPPDEVPFLFTTTDVAEKLKDELRGAIGDPIVRACMELTMSPNEDSNSWIDRVTANLTYDSTTEVIRWELSVPTGKRQDAEKYREKLNDLLRSALQVVGAREQQLKRLQEKLALDFKELGSKPPDPPPVDLRSSPDSCPMSCSPCPSGCTLCDDNCESVVGCESLCLKRFSSCGRPRKVHCENGSRCAVPCQSSCN